MKSKFLKIGMPVISSLGVVAIVIPILTTCSNANSVYENFAAKVSAFTQYANMQKTLSTLSIDNIKTKFEQGGEFFNVGKILGATSSTISENDLKSFIEQNTKKQKVQQEQEWTKIVDGKATISNVEIKGNKVIVTFNSDIYTLEQTRNAVLKQYEVIPNGQESIKWVNDTFNLISSTITSTSRTITITTSVSK